MQDPNSQLDTNRPCDNEGCINHEVIAPLGVGVISEPIFLNGQQNEQIGPFLAQSINVMVFMICTMGMWIYRIGM
jgi:hypothetical protein